MPKAESKESFMKMNEGVRQVSKDIISIEM